GIYYSYQFIPLQNGFLPLDQEQVPMFVVKTFTAMFVIAFQMAIPIVASIFLLDVALGIIARTVPQVNVFVVGLPLKILAGFIVILMIMPILFMTIQYIVEQMAIVMREFMRLIGAL
ncbi:MAG TPA: flagellar biosynthetic protein FliR, partial [Massilibacterium sp.]|nr:flagellar biosynthetic protein FliR [Massilibacterium sp.]